MFKKGYESRIKVQDVVANHLPEFILDESPKAIEFLKQYYVSQEYQGGVIDIAENLDEYLKVDNFTPEVIVGTVTLDGSIDDTTETITISPSTKGFPKKYGLIKIDDEIITYTGITTNTFTGCVRGFSGITDFHDDLNTEELVFSSSSAASHNDSASVKNLSVLFLQEFYKKIKYSLTPGFEDLNFVPELNVGNFIKESRTFYESKGTDESFRILFNVLFNETPRIVDLEQFLIKPSSATYMRREVVVADLISGDPLKLKGQTIKKKNDDRSTAAVSEVEVISRKGKTYYKILLFIGYDDSFPTVTGDFNITGSSKVLDTVSIGSSVISVDSTIGFPASGKIYYGDIEIDYTFKSVNQFFGCSGISSSLPKAAIVRSDEIYYGYEDGDLSKRVDFRITGVLSKYRSVFEESLIRPDEKISIKSLGEIISNPDSDPDNCVVDYTVNPTNKEVFANSWIYNTSCRYKILSHVANTPINTFVLKGTIDKSSLKVGDYIDILSRDSLVVIESNLQITSIVGNQITTDQYFTLNASQDFDIRRRIEYARSSSVQLEYDPIFANIQNVYNDNDEYMYVASNSLPSYTITNPIFSYNAYTLGNQDLTTLLYSSVIFLENVSFFTGNAVRYTYSSQPFEGLTQGGIYYVELLSPNAIRLYSSRTSLETGNYLELGAEFITGDHIFTLLSQSERIISPQRILRKFPLYPNIGDGKSDLTEGGSIGMLVNGVEITSYKSNRKVYFGPLEKVKVLNNGKGYDVVNPPLLELSTGNAAIQPVIKGSVERVDVVPQEFDINGIVSISMIGGNGSGASFRPIIETRRRELEFDGRITQSNGGVDVIGETITFRKNHSLVDGQEITYRPGNNAPLGISDFEGLNISSGNTLVPEGSYYAKIISDRTIQIYSSKSDYTLGINTIGFSASGNSGLHKFVTEPKKTLKDIRVINPGSGYENRKLRVLPTNISLTTNVISFENHGFKEGDVITYNYEGSSITGLSTTTQYYVIKVDNDNFRLANAGIGGTFRSDYERGKYVKFTSSGSGYQIFNYPEIELNVEYVSVGIGTTQFRGSIDAKSIIKGEIVDVFVYDKGTNYGSTILDYHKKPSIIVKNGKEAEVKPIIVNGRITDVSVQYGGREYYSTPDIKIYGSGIGAVLRPVIENKKIVDVIVVNKGLGYSASDTVLVVESAGKNAIFDCKVRSLEINTNALYTEYGSSSFANELIKSSYNNLQYSICGYFEDLQEKFNDDGSCHSPIIGWAYDGNPIYGSWGYSNPQDKNSTIKKLYSGYVLNPSNIYNRPPGISNGFFVDDYKFTNSGDLDQYNGRFCITPEFPNGTYAYFATTVDDGEGNLVGSFPYFVGNRYRSKFIRENKTLNQDFDFNNSNLIRNTFPYKIADKDSNNDFIIESNEIVNQLTTVESVTTGSVTDFDIISGGNDYVAGDLLQFDESNNKGGGLIAEVYETKNDKILNLETSIVSYDDSLFIWKTSTKIEVLIKPNHVLNNLDNVSISGFSTELSSLNGFYKIGVTTFSTTLIEDIPNYATTGDIADIYVSSIPNNLSIGSSIVINDDYFSVLNIFPKDLVIRSFRKPTGIAHTSAELVYFIPDRFTFGLENELPYFESEDKKLVYFNPNNSIGVGTDTGISVNKTYKVGSYNYQISIPTQSIYLPGNTFQNKEKIIIRKPFAASSIAVSKTIGDGGFDIFNGGSSGTFYVIKKSPDYIGIVTTVGLTTTSNGLFFLTDGSDDYTYSIESAYAKSVKADVKRIKAKVTTSDNHQLNNGDIINLSVSPNIAVGIGNSTFVNVKYDSARDKLLIDPISFTSSKISVSTDKITLIGHGLKTGQKILYTATTPATGLSNGTYFVYKVDEDAIKLCETFKDATSSSPRFINITAAPSSNHQISQINPPISVHKNNNLVFKLSDSTLSGIGSFKLFYDRDFSDEFVATGLTTSFSVKQYETIGISSLASLTIDYSESVPPKLFYALEKSGYISTSDKEVINYSEINFVDSFYNNAYEVDEASGKTFEISLPRVPERNNYSKFECDVLEYKTRSKSSLGSISKIRIVSPGFNFDKPPIFIGTKSASGYGAYIIPKSESIGKINQIRILNEGFEYPSDRTLRPEASISRLLTIKNSNTIKKVKVTFGGRNYSYAPDLIIVDSTTGDIIDSGLLIADLKGATSIKTVTVDTPPVGLPETTVRIVAINNTNGVKIEKLEITQSGTILCTLVTPLSGFSAEPFAIGDQIFIEKVKKEGTEGTGFNSEDYGFAFFTVIDYLNAGTASKRILEFSLSDYTENPGIPNNIENDYGVIVNYKNYPRFSIDQVFSDFIINESLEVDSGDGFIIRDLRVVESSKNDIKVFGLFEVRVNYILRGVESGSRATIGRIRQSKGYFDTDYSSAKNFGWSDNIGILNEDIQVIEDNDYYQNLSYTVKSTKEWEDIVSPVNNLVHPSGIKNFADTQITNNINFNSRREGNGDTLIVCDIIETIRVDTVNNFDCVEDINVDTENNYSKFIKFGHKRLTDYIECKTNRVLKIDDISDEFSTFYGLDQYVPHKKVSYIDPLRRCERFLVQITSNDLSKIQFTELIVLSDDIGNIFTLEKGTLNNGFIAETGYPSNKYGSFSGYIDEYNIPYLRFDPSDPYNDNFNIKVLNTSFLNSSTGIGTTSFGFLSLVGVTSTISGNSTGTIFTRNKSKTQSIYSQVSITDSVTFETNYFEVFVDHDGTNTSLSELYFDSDEEYDDFPAGSFQSSISGQNVILTYTNASSNPVTIKSRNVGFGTTESGTGTYIFKQANQPIGIERFVKYQSNYSNVSSASTIASFSANEAISVKSTIRVNAGSKSALHQVMMIRDNNDAYLTQYPFISVGSSIGIGTFGADFSNSTLSLIFYPDVGITGNIEILNFNEIFHSKYDFKNSPNNLLYGGVIEAVGVTKYKSFNSSNLNRVNFDLNYEEIPIFMKTFDPSDSSVVSAAGTITIPNHFFSTGEELIYRPNTEYDELSIGPVGIGSTLNYVGVVTDILPSTVYAIKIDNNNFKIATRREYALADPAIAVTFTSVGSGNAHELEMFEKNSKVIISIDNIVQSPLAFKGLSFTVNNEGPIGTSSTIFGLSGISSIIIGDILKIDDEYMKITSVGIGTTYSGPVTFEGDIPLVRVDRGSVGSAATTHQNGSEVEVYSGSFNIVKNEIFFVNPPTGDASDEYIFDFDNLPEARSTFNGRVFLRKDYSTNEIFDDVSTKFDGIRQRFELTVGGINTVGLGSSGENGIVLINGIYQSPETENNDNYSNYSIIENSISGITSVVFSGVRDDFDNLITSENDVNQNGLPRGGIIVSLGSTGGLGYAPLVGASVTAFISAGSIVSLGIGTIGSWGSGYSNPVSVAVTEYGHTGTGAIIQANVGAGGTLSFTVVSGGNGYLNPTINISPPSYGNLPVKGISRPSIGSTTETGTGLLLNIEVGASSTTGIGSTLFEVTGFEISNNGYGFRIGDVITPVGLVTSYGLSSPISEFQLTVLDIFYDAFSSWQFGQVDYIDSIKPFQNGKRVRFPLYYNAQLLSFHTSSSYSDSEVIDLDALLIIFINGVLQEPGTCYQFSGGSSFTFAEAPQKSDQVDIFFYRGSYGDSDLVDITETIKVGDDVRIYSHNGYLGITTTQDKRLVTDIPTSDKIETDLYFGLGIDETICKPIYWTRQKVDKVINGEYVSKARDSIEIQIYPTAKIIKSFDSNDTEIFIDDAQFFNYENPDKIDFDGLIVETLDACPAAATAVVSIAGTIQTLILDDPGCEFTPETLEIGSYITPDFVWTIRTRPGVTPLYGALYEDNTYLLAGGSGSMLSSTDSITWVFRTSGVTVSITDTKYIPIPAPIPPAPNPTYQFTSRDVSDFHFFRVAYGNGTYVVMGLNSIFASTNTITWVIRTTGFNGYVDFAKDRFYMTGSSDYLSTSTDSITWTFRTSGATNNGAINGITYGTPNGNDLYVAYKNTGIILTSTNAIAWTMRTSGTPVEIFNVVYGANTFVRNGYSTASSTDGITWTLRSSIHPINYGLAYGNGLFILVGAEPVGPYSESNATIEVSTNGIVWVARTTPMTYPAFSSYLYTVAAGNGYYFAGGAGNGGYLLQSTDSIIWTIRTLGFNVALGDMVYASNDSFVYTSTGGFGSNGVVGSTFTGPFVYPNIGPYVLVGTGGAFSTSTNGIVWIKRTTGTSSSIAQVVAGKNPDTTTLYMFCADSTSNVFRVSTDTITWVARTTSAASIIKTLAYNEAGTNPYVIATSTGRVLSSTDTIVWTLRSAYSTGHQKLEVGNGNFILGSQSGIIQVSTNAIFWIIRTGVSSSAIYSINYSSQTGSYVLGHQDGSITTSTDTIVWTRRTSYTTQTITALTYGNGKYVYGDTNGRLGTSDGPSVSQITYGQGVPAYIANPPCIGEGECVGVATEDRRARAVISVDGSGNLTSPIYISNPGCGYDPSYPPEVIIPLPDPVYENIKKVTSVEGFSGKIVAIQQVVGIGVPKAIRFSLDPQLTPFPGLKVGNPIYIFNTSVGEGVKSIIDSDSTVIGVGITFVDNIYQISAIDNHEITCNVHSASNLTGINTNGFIVGNFSWGRLSGFSRSSSPISIGVSGFTPDVGLSTYPTIQRRGYGLRNIGPVKKLGVITKDCPVYNLGISDPSLLGFDSYPTGTIWATGDLSVYSTLYAFSSISDDDGIASPIVYTWFADDVPLANGASYTLTPNESNKEICIRAAYTDADGDVKSLQSCLPGTVQGAPIILTSGTLTNLTITPTSPTQQYTYISGVSGAPNLSINITSTGTPTLSGYVDFYRTYCFRYYYPANNDYAGTYFGSPGSCFTNSYWGRIYYSGGVYTLGTLQAIFNLYQIGSYGIIGSGNGKLSHKVETENHYLPSAPSQERYYDSLTLTAEWH